MGVIERLEREFARFIGLKTAVSFSFGRNGLYTLLKSLDVKENDEIIIPALTCSSIPETIKQLAARPVLVDVNETFTIDEKKITKKISKRTKAILVIHTYGNPARIDKIKTIAKKNDLVLIEDCAHAIGSKYKGKLVGSFGDYAIFSLNKQMVNFCGGIIASNKPLDNLKNMRDTLDKRVDILRSLRMSYYLPFRLMSSCWDSRGSQFSKSVINLISGLLELLGIPPNDSEMISRFRIYGVASSLALDQIKKLKEENKKRKEIASKLRELFNDKDMKLQKILPQSNPTFSYFAILLTGRDEISRGDFWRPWKQYGKSAPFAKTLSKNLMVLPVNPYYTEDYLLKLREFKK